MKRNGLMTLLVCLGLPLAVQTAPVALADCVPECTADPGEDVLEFVVINDTECLQPGEQVVVELRQRDLTQLVRGFQAFFQYDPTCMSITEAAIATTSDPYGRVIRKVVDGPNGTIDLAMGINDLVGQPPTQADAVLATLTFDTFPGVECINEICFREHEPPSRFSDPTGLPIEPCLKFSGPIIIDGTDPEITCPGDEAYQCLSGVPAPDINLVTVTDNLDPNPVVTWEGDTDNGGSGCPSDPLIISRVYRATDCADNYAECTQTFTIIDDTDPTITCPADVSASADPGECFASQVNLGMPTVDDNCGVTNTPTNDAPAQFPVGDTTVTWTVTDACGNSASCMQTVTVTDDEDPTITCPTDVTVDTDPGVCYATGVDLGTPTTDDNCAVDTVTNDAPAQFPLGDTTVTWTVTDVNGRTATCTQTVTVEDNEDPTITCPADVSASADPGVCYATNVDLGLPMVGDNCCVDTVTNDAPDQFPVGDTTVTWTATDPSGNSATCAQIVTVTDDEDPTITCPDDVEVDADPGQCYATNVDLGTPTTGDNCAVDTVTNDAPAQFPVGDTTVTWTVTDIYGNTATCTQIVTVNDIIDPTITCPPDVTVDTDPGVCYATGVDLGTPTTDDNCGIDSVTNDAPAEFQIGDTTVTWTVTDLSGNTATCTQTVTVEDNEDPTITCPPDVSVAADPGVCYATGVDLGTPTTDDNCAVKSVTNDAPAQFPIGDTTVTWTVTDVYGNMATCTQIVTVTDDEDPTITCPPDVSVAADPGECYATGVDLGTPTTGDNCGVDTVGNDAPAEFPVGDTTVTWTVTDLSGNTATCTQIVTVTDGEDPTITCPPNVTVSADPGECYATGVDLGTPTVDDNCGVDTVTNDAPAQFPVGDTTVTWTVTDLGGNTATCTQTVTVNDGEDPVITCPPDVTVDTDPGECYATGVDLGTPTVDDNCGVGPVTNDAPTQFPPGDTTVTWTVEDIYGNTATCTQVVTVEDNEDPTITCPADVTVGNDPGECYATNVALGTPTTDDNCGVDTVGNDAPAQYPVGDTTVTWTVTDVNGNFATCAQIVTVTDDEPPTITCPDDVSVENDPGECYATGVDLGTPITDDNCVVDSVTNDAPAEFPVGTTTVTWTVSDGYNTATCTQTVTVADTEPPAFDPNCEERHIKIFPNVGECIGHVQLDFLTAIDNCDNDVEVVQYRSDGVIIEDPLATQPPFLPGDTNIWWVATDDAGNSTYCLWVVQIESHALVQVYVEMKGQFEPTSRCVHFELWACPDNSATADEEVLFLPNPPPFPFSAGVAQLRVPCDFTYDCITAQDMLHTLRNTTDMNTEVYENSYGYDRTRYVAEFLLGPGGDIGTALLAGNLDACQLPDDWFIDILDFGVFSWQWQKLYYSGQPVTHPPVNGNTPCPTSGDACELFPHADINADGIVDNQDYDFIFVNFLEQYVPNCCGAPGKMVAHTPITSISVRELQSLGWGHLAAGDLNADGYLDVEDMNAFMQGARPRPFDVDPGSIEPIEKQDLNAPGSLKPKARMR